MRHGLQGSGQYRVLKQLVVKRFKHGEQWEAVGKALLWWWLWDQGQEGKLCSGGGCRMRQREGFALLHQPSGWAVGQKGQRVSPPAHLLPH